MTGIIFENYIKIADHLIFHLSQCVVLWCVSCLETGEWGHVT